MTTDTLQQVADSIMTQAADAGTAINYWMIIAIVEFVIILVLIARATMRHGPETEKQRIKKKVMDEGTVDFGNIVNSAFNAPQLYKDLMRKCHPDRFAPDADKMAIADDITMRLGKCKHDVKALQQLKKEAEEKLNINL